MTVDCGIDRQMMLLIETHRDSREASAPEELSDFLRRGRRWPFWIDVDHLSRAIDDHSKLRHLMRAEQAVEMRPANQINVALVGNLHRNICESAVTHRESGEFADTVTLGNPSHASDVRFSFLDSKSQFADTRAVDQRVRAAGIDH